MQRFAWVCGGLIAAYRPKHRAFILELLGLGGGVLDELNSLLRAGWGTSQRKAVSDRIGGIHHYMWRRPDSLSGGGAWQFKTAPDEVLRLMSRLRDQLVSGAVTLLSERCAKELERVRQEGNEFVAEGQGATTHHLHA